MNDMTLKQYGPIYDITTLALYYVEKNKKSF